MIREDVDRRVLGAVRIVDAITGQRVVEPLELIAEGVTLVRNLSGDLVIRDVSPALSRELRAHTLAFDAPPAEPLVGEIEIDMRVSDYRRRYLPRRATLFLPRDPDPDNTELPESLFQPIVLRMFRSPAGAVSGGWAVLHVHLPGEEQGEVLAGALIRVLRTSDDELLGAGLTDERGEALIAIAGIPVTTFDPGEPVDPDEPLGPPTGPVLITSVAATLEVLFDPEAAWPPDPDDLEERAAELLVRTATVNLRSGESQSLSI
jgi:hypothetical protein